MDQEILFIAGLLSVILSVVGLCVFIKFRRRFITKITFISMFITFICVLLGYIVGRMGIHFWNTLIVASVGTGSFIFALYLFMRVISSPVNKLIDIVRDIAEGEGDLTRRVDIQSKDEVGELARWENLFLDKMQNIIKDISGNAETLNESSSNLSELSGRMSSGADNMSGKSDTVAKSAEEMNSNMTTVAAAIEQASTNVGMVATASEEMTATINEIAQNSEK
ncbi:MAG: HAMP domain-containing protein, partial [Thermodesulfobacteriota bacterium]|nr:HAMP domain-containing protein [Thermodesulfobacteriota bacterium]